MSLSLIRKGFESRLKTWADAQTPAIPVAWPNVAFTPPAGRFARADLLPNETQARTLERTDRSFAGIFQVTLSFPVNTGAGQSETLAASLDTALPHTFVQDTVRIYLTTPMSPAPPIQNGDRFLVPVSCQYRADVYV